MGNHAPTPSSHVVGFILIRIRWFSALGSLHFAIVYVTTAFLRRSVNFVLYYLSPNMYIIQCAIGRAGWAQVATYVLCDRFQPGGNRMVPRVHDEVIRSDPGLNIPSQQSAFWEKLSDFKYIVFHCRRL